MSLPDPSPEWNFNEECPHCGTKLRDLCEYFGSGNETAAMECPSCNKEIIVVLQISYIIKPKETV